MRRITLLAMVVGLVGVGQAEGAVLYSVTDLGDLSGGEDMSHAMAVNNTGQVVGISEAAGGTRAFLWENGVMTDLDTLTDEHHYSWAWDINDSGQIVGTSGVDGTGGGVLSRRPFLYSDGSMSVLTGFGDDYGEARGINNASEVVGISHYSHGAFLYSGGTMTDLGSLGGIPPYSDAYGINDFTQVVGGVNYVGDSDFNRGVLWEDDTMTDLGDLPGNPETTRAYDINNLGQVVGESGVPSPSIHRAFLWENGVMTDLGVWPGTNMSNAQGINDSGLAVGTSFNYDPITHTGQDHRAFVWDSTNEMQDLNSMLDSSGAGWTLKGCRDISNAGHIVGWGINPDGSQHGFLLTPVPEPASITLLLCGALGLLAYGWRRRKA